MIVMTIVIAMTAAFNSGDSKQATITKPSTDAAVVDKLPRSLDIERLTLRSADGDQYATIGLNKDGTIGLTFFDKQQRARLVVGVTPDGTPRQQFLDEHGT